MYSYFAANFQYVYNNAFAFSWVCGMLANKITSAFKSESYLHTSEWVKRFITKDDASE